MGPPVPTRLPTISREQLTYLANTGNLNSSSRGIFHHQPSVRKDISPGEGGGMPEKEESAEKVAAAEKLNFCPQQLKWTGSKEKLLSRSLSGRLMTICRQK